MPYKRRKRTFHKDGTESDLERLFQFQWLSNYPTYKPVTQLKFHSTRQWQFDFAWPLRKVAVEIQGSGPGHFSVAGATRDYDKLMAALLLQWRVVYLTNQHLTPEKWPQARETIARLLGIPIVPSTTHYVPINKRRQ